MLFPLDKFGMIYKNIVCTLASKPDFKSHGNDLLSCGSDLLTCGNDLVSCG